MPATTTTRGGSCHWHTTQEGHWEQASKRDRSVFDVQSEYSYRRAEEEEEEAEEEEEEDEEEEKDEEQEEVEEEEEEGVEEEEEEEEEDEEEGEEEEDEEGEEVQRQPGDSSQYPPCHLAHRAVPDETKRGARHARPGIKRSIACGQNTRSSANASI